MNDQMGEKILKNYVRESQVPLEGKWAALNAYLIRHNLHKLDRMASL